MCGGAIVPMGGEGRTTRHKTIMAMSIPNDFEIPTCDQCGAEWFDEKTAKDLDAVLEPIYQVIMRSSK